VAIKVAKWFSEKATLISNPHVAVVGASSLVGEKLLDVLTERQFPHASLTCLSPRGTAPAAAADADLVFLAAPEEVARKFAPQLVTAGCLVIDLSSAWSLDAQVPLVVPEVNGATIALHRGLIASPNCTNVPLVMALAALSPQAVVEQVMVTTMQAASGAGRAGLESLQGGASPFAHNLANNLIPQCDVLNADGTSAEEQRLVAETRRLLASADLAITATCVRAPVLVGHALSVYIRLQTELDAADARAAWQAAPGIKVYGGNDYPCVQDCVGNDLVHIGRVRNGLQRNELLLWIVCDNLRKGAATNAIQIAEQLLLR